MDFKQEIITAVKSKFAFIFPAALFFISGACGLLYQVVWTRKLVLLFGTTSYAVSTVLAVFFVGLGAGSLIGGRWADRCRRPLFLYGLFELIIGLWALLFIFTIDPSESLIVGVLRGWAGSRIAAVGIRTMLATAWLIVPVFLMGATLPLLAKFVVRDPAIRGRRIGALYSLNTFGAVAGCAATGFAILPALGYTRSTLLGAAANFAIGLLAMAFGRAASRDEVPAMEPETVGAEKSLPAGALLLCAFAICGACALAFEVLWTRLLTMVFIGTTYAFTTMLSTLLFGIAVGSAVASSLIDKRRDARAVFGVVVILIGAAAIAMLAVFAKLPGWLQQMQLDAGYDWDKLVRAKFILSFLVLFPPTFLSGMTFPIVVRAMTQTQGRLGRDVGILYSANTLGGVIGSMAGGFVIIPLLGTHCGILTLALILVVTGAVVLIAAADTSARRRAAFLAPALLLAAVAYAISPGDITQSLNNGYIPADQRLLFYTEGTEGSVAVSGPVDDDSGANRTLWINAVQATASIEKGVRMNRFQGVLPLMFDRDPKRVLFMCFGSGITAGTLGLYNYDRIDAVEICPEVLKAAPYFRTDNLDVIGNPRVKFHIDDGRNFLLTTPERYDVITFEPMPLAMAGVSTFYTRDYYRLCMERLAPGGLVSQWVPLHSLNPELVQSLTATFTSVFPEYCAWFINADMFLIGSNQPLAIDYSRAAQRLADPVIAKALHDCGFADVPEVVTCFFMGKDALRGYAQPGAIMTDDRPWAEFIAPKLMYERTVQDTLARIVPSFESPVPYLTEAGDDERAAVERRHLAKAHDLQGLIIYYGGTFGSEPEKHFKQALAVDPLDSNARYYLEEILLSRVKTFLRWQEPEKAITALTDALKYAEMPSLLLALGDIYYEAGDMPSARGCYTRYANAGGAQPQAIERAAKINSDLKNPPNSADK
jgi:spermidine synthase